MTQGPPQIIEFLIQQLFGLALCFPNKPLPTTGTKLAGVKHHVGKRVEDRFRWAVATEPLPSRAKLVLNSDWRNKLHFLVAFVDCKECSFANVAGGFRP